MTSPELSKFAFFAEIGCSVCCRTRNPYISSQYAQVIESFEAQKDEQGGFKKLGSYIAHLTMQQLESLQDRLPGITRKQADDILFIMRNYGNNLNQIAYQMNLDGKQLGRRGMNTQPENKAILKECFELLDDLEAELQDYLSSEP